MQTVEKKVKMAINAESPKELGTIEDFFAMLPRQVISWLAENTVDGTSLMETAAAIVTDVFHDEIDKAKVGIDTRVMHIELKNGLSEGTLEKIISAVERNTSITRKEMFGKAKQPHIYKARAALAGLLRDMTPMSLTDLGKLFNRDHTSMVYTLDRYNHFLLNEGRFLSTINFIKADMA